jgi:hypothetical protein
MTDLYSTLQQYDKSQDKKFPTSGTIARIDGGFVDVTVRGMSTILRNVKCVGSPTTAGQAVVLTWENGVPTAHMTDGSTASTAVALVRGPQGLDGPQGPAGPTGAQGPAGPTGPTGAQGTQGIQGIQGIQGPTGLTGAVSAATSLALIEQALDPAAIAGDTIVYAKTDHKVYKRIPSGTITELGAGAGGGFTASTTAPVNPISGDEWYNTNTGVLYKYINDGDSSQWIDTSSSGALLDHTLLTNIGTNTHAQIDTQLATLLPASGSAVLGAAFVVTGADWVYQDTGLAVTLPRAGTYKVDACVRGVMQNNQAAGNLVVKLYNATLAADVVNSETLVVYPTAANTLFQNTVYCNGLVTVAGPTVIKLYACRALGTAIAAYSQVDSNYGGRTRIMYVKVG